LSLQGNDAGETLSLHAKELKLPRHEAIRGDIEHYTPLMHWLKLMDRKAFVSLTQVYVQSLGKLYTRDIREFFEEAKNRVTAGKDRKHKGSGSREDLAGKFKQQAHSLGSSNKGAPQGNLLGESVLYTYESKKRPGWAGFILSFIHSFSYFTLFPIALHATLSKHSTFAPGSVISFIRTTLTIFLVVLLLCRA